MLWSKTAGYATDWRIKVTNDLFVDEPIRLRRRKHTVQKVDNLESTARYESCIKCIRDLSTLVNEDKHFKTKASIKSPT
jgi:hypothetical protein